MLPEYEHAFGIRDSLERRHHPLTNTIRISFLAKTLTKTWGDAAALAAIPVVKVFVEVFAAVLVDTKYTEYTEYTK